MRKLACLVLFALSFGAVAAWFSAATPNPPREELTAKLTYFARNRDQFDLVIFGSSRSWRAVIPAQLDADLAKRGLTVHSFNLALPGMESHEINATLRRALGLHPKKLRWVLVEVEDWSGRLDSENELKARTIRWHDRRETWSVLRTIALADLSWPVKVRQGWSHLLHGIAFATGAGQGPTVVRQRLGDSGVPANRLKRLEANRGWEPFVAKAGSNDQRDANRRAFLADPEGYRRRTQSLRQRTRRAADFAHYPVAAIAEQVAMIRTAGYEPIHIIPPTLAANNEARVLAEQGVIPTLLAFNDAVAYRDLYRVNLRWDAEHLTPAGAKLFTEALAARLADHLGAPPLAASPPAP